MRKAVTLRSTLITCDEMGKRLGVVSTGLWPLTKHGKVTPKFHAYCVALFALRPDATSIEVMEWQAGVDVACAPAILVVTRTDQAGQLAYQIPSEVEREEMEVQA